MSRRPRGRGRKPQHNNNRNNNLNRSLDSNGPDVRVRGSAKTIYDKYMSLAHDASVSGRRVKAESYLQHAEHYLRVVQELADIAEQNAKQRRNINEKREDEQAARQVEHAVKTEKNKKPDDGQKAKGENPDGDQNQDKDSDKPESRSRSGLNRRRNGKSSDKDTASSDESQAKTSKNSATKKPAKNTEATATE